MTSSIVFSLSLCFFLSLHLRTRTKFRRVERNPQQKHQHFAFVSTATGCILWCS